MDITRIPTLENLDLEAEWDAAYEDQQIDPEHLEECGLISLVICGSSCPGVMEGVSYLHIDSDYDQTMSEGQRDLYKLLYELQAGAVYSITSVNKLMGALDLKNPLSVIQRLENLQSIGAISGLRL